MLKKGTHFDLPIAIAIAPLAMRGMLLEDIVKDWLILGAPACDFSPAQHAGKIIVSGS